MILLFSIKVSCLDTLIILLVAQFSFSIYWLEPTLTILIILITIVKLNMILGILIIVYLAQCPI